MGAELRMENYEITAGEEAGYADYGYDVLDQRWCFCSSWLSMFTWTSSS